MQKLNNWDCGYCKSPQPESRLSCSQCGAPRPKPDLTMLTKWYMLDLAHDDAPIKKTSTAKLTAVKFYSPF